MISRFDLFRNNLTACLTAAEVMDLCQHECQQLRRQFDSLATLKNNYTAYRKVCREKIDPMVLTTCLDLFRLSKEESRLFNATYEQKIAHEHRNLRPLQKCDVMIGLAHTLLGASSVYDQILGLACLTGRRVAEVACTAHLTPLTPDRMLFDGQIKTKTRAAPSYQIPVLGNAQDIADSLQTLRVRKPHWIGQTVLFNNCGSRHLSLRVKKHFAPFMDNPTAKDLRAAYAEICYARYGAAHIAKSRFFSDILGHGLEDNTTGLSYLDFYLVQGEEDV